MTDPLYIDIDRLESHLKSLAERNKKAEEDILSGYVRPEDVHTIGFTPAEARQVCECLKTEDYTELGELYFQAVVNWRADQLDG